MTDHLKDTDWYCPMPFKYLHVEHDGVSSCCRTPRLPMTIDEYLSSDALLELQNQFLTNQKPVICKSCIDQENQFGDSLRLQSIRDYNARMYVVTDIDSIDYRSSNVCNFKCRMCSPNYSHSINQEVQQNMPTLGIFYPHSRPGKKIIAKQQDHEWILANVDQIQRFMFAGGEPTYMPEVKVILEKIIAMNKSDVQINFTSNCSFKDPIWYEITNTVPNVHWTASIDAIGDDAELIRHGTDWSWIEKNVRWLACHATSVDIHTVITHLNVFRLKPLLRFVREIQEISRPPTGRHGTEGARHLITIISSPQVLAANNWPDDIKPQVLDYLDDCLEMDLQSYQHEQLKNLQSSIKNTPFNATLWGRTQDFNNAFDLVRNENHRFLHQTAI